MAYINTTPHHINLINPDTGEEFVVEKSRWLLNARAEERVVAERNGITFVETVFVPTPEGWEAIREIRAEHGTDAIIVGSIIAAQAYPGEVVAMTPAPGFERVPPAEKKMNAKKFTIFPTQTAPENAVPVQGDFLKELVGQFYNAARTYGFTHDRSTNFDDIIIEVGESKKSLSPADIGRMSFDFKR